VNPTVFGISPSVIAAIFGGAGVLLFSFLQWTSQSEIEKHATGREQEVFRRVTYGLASLCAGLIIVVALARLMSASEEVVAIAANAAIVTLLFALASSLWVRSGGFLAWRWALTVATAFAILVATNKIFTRWLAPMGY
jgi:hypothetical protein